MITLYPIYPKALQLALSIKKTQSISIAERSSSCNYDATSPYLLNMPHKLSSTLGCIRRS